MNENFLNIKHFILKYKGTIGVEKIDDLFKSLNCKDFADFLTNFDKLMPRFMEGILIKEALRSTTRKIIKRY